MRCNKISRKNLSRAIGVTLSILCVFIFATLISKKNLVTSFSPVPRFTFQDNSLREKKIEMKEKKTEQKFLDLWAPLEEKMQTFRKTANIILKTTQEKEAFYAMLSDPVIVEDAVHFLQEVDPKGQSLDLWMGRRIDTIQYLEASIKWKENPMRHDILGKMMDLIETLEPRQESREEEQKAVQGDRVMMYLDLKAHAKKEADEFRQRALKDKNTRGVIQFGDPFYEQNTREGSPRQRSPS